MGGNNHDLSWEDVHVGRAGANFGWPLCEGYCNGTAFSATCDCAHHDNPLYAYSHEGGGAAVIGGPVLLDGRRYPPAFTGSYFFADHVQRWIRVARFNSETGAVKGELLEIARGTGRIIHMRQGTDGWVYFSTEEGELKRILYANNAPPTVHSFASNVTVCGVPCAALFSVEASTIDHARLRYGLMITPIDGHGDGGEPMAIEKDTFESNMLYIFARSGQYAVVTIVTDPVGLFTLTERIVVRVGETPTVTITAPLDGFLFRAGDLITCRGEAVMTSSGVVIPPDRLEWRIRLRHDDHFHPVLDDVQGSETSLFIDPEKHGYTDDVSFVIQLAATAADGVIASAQVEIWPYRTSIELVSEPPGAVAFVDGLPFVAPVVLSTLAGFVHRVEASYQGVCIDNVTWHFKEWHSGDEATDTSLSRAWRAPTPDEATSNDASGRLVMTLERRLPCAVEGSLLRNVEVPVIDFWPVDLHDGLFAWHVSKNSKGIASKIVMQVHHMDDPTVFVTYVESVGHGAGYVSLPEIADAVRSGIAAAVQFQLATSSSLAFATPVVFTLAASTLPATPAMEAMTTTAIATTKKTTVSETTMTKWATTTTSAAEISTSPTTLSASIGTTAAAATATAASTPNMSTSAQEPPSTITTAAVLTSPEPTREGSNATRTVTGVSTAAYSRTLPTPNTTTNNLATPTTSSIPVSARSLTTNAPSSTAASRPSSTSPVSNSTTTLSNASHADTSTTTIRATTPTTSTTTSTAASTAASQSATARPITAPSMSSDANSGAQSMSTTPMLSTFTSVVTKVVIEATTTTIPAMARTTTTSSVEPVGAKATQAMATTSLLTTTQTNSGRVTLSGESTGTAAVTAPFPASTHAEPQTDPKQDPKRATLVNDVTTMQSAGYSLYINAGGTVAMFDAQGQQWSPDEGEVVGEVDLEPPPLLNLKEPVYYQTSQDYTHVPSAFHVNVLSSRRVLRARQGDALTYFLQTSHPGSYELQLAFVDFSSSDRSPRTFAIEINGQRIIPSLNVLEKVNGEQRRCLIVVHRLILSSEASGFQVRLLRQRSDPFINSIGLVALSGGAYPEALKAAMSVGSFSFLRQISCGEDRAHVSPLTGVWADDANYTSPGPIYQSSLPSIRGAGGDDFLYQTERAGARRGQPLRYDIPVPAEGLYIVELLFAEIYLPNPSNRVLRISLGNAPVAPPFDVAKEVGTHMAYVRRFVVETSAPRAIVIHIEAVSRTAKVNGIRVYDAGAEAGQWIDRESHMTHTPDSLPPATLVVTSPDMSTVGSPQQPSAKPNENRGTDSTASNGDDSSSAAAVSTVIAPLAPAFRLIASSPQGGEGWRTTKDVRVFRVVFPLGPNLELECVAQCETEPDCVAVVLMSPEVKEGDTSAGATCIGIARLEQAMRSRPFKAWVRSMDSAMASTKASVTGSQSASTVDALQDSTTLEQRGGSARDRTVEPPPDTDFRIAFSHDGKGRTSGLSRRSKFRLFLRKLQSSSVGGAQENCKQQCLRRGPGCVGFVLWAQKRQGRFKCAGLAKLKRAREKKKSWGFVRMATRERSAAEDDALVPAAPATVRLVAQQARFSTTFWRGSQLAPPYDTASVAMCAAACTEQPACRGFVAWQPDEGGEEKRLRCALLSKLGALDPKVAELKPFHKPSWCYIVE